MAFVTENENGRIIIRAGGVIDFYEANAFRNEIIAGFESGDDITIDLGQVSGCDLTCIQILCSAGKTASRTKKRLELINIPDSVSELMKETFLAADRLGG